MSPDQIRQGQAQFAASRSNPFSKGAPPPPNFMGAAGYDWQKQTQANRPGISTSFGGQQWTQGPNGQWQMSTSLDPSLQGLQGQLTGQLSSASGKDAYNKAANAAYQQETSRLDPQWNQRQEQLGSQLAAQGLPPGSPAYTQAMNDFNRQRTDAYQTALNQSAGLGLQAQQAQFGMGLGGLGALHGFETQMPGFNAAGNPNYLQALMGQANYGLEQQKLQNEQQAQQMGGFTNMLGGIGDLALLSDERVKTDVQRLPVEAHPGVPLATFRFKHAPEKGHQLGVIAQDVEKVAPHAVNTDEAGLKHVDYSKLKPFGLKR